MAREIGSEKIGVKFSPQIPFNDVEELDADELYPYILERLSEKHLAYVHVGMGGDWHAKLRPHYTGVYFAGAGFTRESAAELLEKDGADAVVFGVMFLANPDLPERFRRGAELNEPDQQTFYAPGPRGYTDSPVLDHAA